LQLGEESVDTHAYAREAETKKGMDAAQITGSASSYARKYALNGLFLIDDTKDPDSTNKHGKEKKKPAKPKAKPAKTEEPAVAAPAYSGSIEGDIVLFFDDVDLLNKLHAEKDAITAWMLEKKFIEEGQEWYKCGEKVLARIKKNPKGFFSAIKGKK
jgi:hypothetical protein